MSGCILTEAQVQAADDRCQSLQGASARFWGAWRQSGHGAHKRGLNTKLHLAVDAHGLPIRAVITQGTTADCTQAGPLIEGLRAQYLLAGRGDDTNAILALEQAQGMAPVIPSRKSRARQRDHDKDLHKLRHLVENAFLYLKRWRGIATRYAKNSAAFLAAIHIRCIAIWAEIS